MIGDPSTLPPVHAYAAQYPLLRDTDLKALAADIEAHGQREPIVMQAGVLIDGRNRWLACALAGVEPTVREYDAEQDGPVEDFIDSVNLHRRHMTATQRALAGARILERLTAAGKARKTANLRQGEAAPEGDKLTPSGKSIDEAARISGSSAGSIKAAVKVLKSGTPELVEAVSAGTIAVSVAATLATTAPAEQRASIERGRTTGTAGRNTAAVAAAPPREPLVLFLAEVDPARRRHRQLPTLRRVLGAALVLSVEEQRALCQEVLERLHDPRDWLS